MSFLKMFYGNRSKRGAAFYDDIAAMSHELWGITRDELEQLHLVRKSDVDRFHGAGTLASIRQAAAGKLVSVSASRLWPTWSNTRDAAWLYSHKDYFWDSLLSALGGSLSRCERSAMLVAGTGATPKRIYDWGAGPGLTTLVLAKLFPGAEVHFNEYPGSMNVQAFEWFKERYSIKNVRWVKSAEGEYDLIQALEIVEHIPLLNAAGKQVSDAAGNVIGDAWSECRDLLCGHLAHGGHLIWNTLFAAERKNDVLGHFLVYDVAGERVPYHRAGVYFRRQLALPPLSLETIVERKFADGVWIFRFG